MSSDPLLSATSLDTTPFDYVIVGAGAGGGPLAARLARAGKRVLVLEAGGDPALKRSRDFPQADPGEVHTIPGYHAAATEDQEMSWQFSVRHYEDDARQEKDDKYNQVKSRVAERFLDAPDKRQRGKRGIFYPRSSGVGGCTAHHAMIVVAPNDKDWDEIADRTGDDSWRAAQMRGYFTKLERCLYLKDYANWLRKLLGVFYYLWRGIVLILKPRAVLDEGGHGTDGWQPTKFLDPELINGIAKSDRGFIRLLVRAGLSVLHRDRRLIGLLKQALFSFRLVAHIDPNDQNTRRVSPEGVFLIPTGIEGRTIKTQAGQVMTGCRVGVRDFLRETENAYKDYLVIAEGYHVTRVIFGTGEQAPRAIGVEAAKGEYLYEASPLQQPAPSERVRFFTRGEVILSGGAFNTPQMLLLSGIGDKQHLKDKAVPGLIGRDGQPLAGSDGKPIGIVHLPGVGNNLQDRYEVSVISELNRKFPTLDKVSFAPGDPNDPARINWKANRSGLYAGNGGTIALMKRSAVVGKKDPEPDLFIFGVPAAFRGYYWGWSRELFRNKQGNPNENEERKLWSWVILKAYTQNERGYVRLRTNIPFDQPEICFDSFNEAAEKQKASGVWLGEKLECALENSKKDALGLVDAVKTVRAINRCNSRQFVNELQPGAAVQDGSAEMLEWVKTQAWGHHASCTCRMGADHWQKDTSRLTDEDAVLDSRFRVHGVERLRVVDASVFPKIPGYFILAPTLMISEKAAVTLLEDAQETAYPEALRKAEMEAIKNRRQCARGAPEMPGTVGLALSGGGIRSATISLGILQAVAALNRLRSVDFLSTVSGGAFTGSFLGRLFTRAMVTKATDPVGRVQDILSDQRSAPMMWVRTQANYILGAGTVDLRQNIALYFRNLFTIHLVIGALIFAAFGLLRGIGTYLPEWTHGHTLQVRGVILTVSAWWWLPLVMAGIAVLPGALGYWLAPSAGSPRPHPLLPLVAWVVLLTACVGLLALPGGAPFALVGAVILILTWLWQEVARWGHRPEDGHPGIVVRNRLTRSLGEALVLFALLTGWVILDTLAQNAASKGVASLFTMMLVALTPFLPLLRKLAEIVRRRVPRGGGTSLSVVTGVLGIVLAGFLLFILDLLAHVVFGQDLLGGWLAIAIAAVFSAAVGRALPLLNQSSLHASYAARLARTFQGASNEARVYSATTNKDVQLTHPGDDVPFDQYHPEAYGCPLHLIGVCINETVDSASEREIRERKGLPMCLGPKGVSVGRRFHALWVPGPDDQQQDGTRATRWRQLREILTRRSVESDWLKPIRASNDPGAFHVFGSRQPGPAPVERLLLGEWTAISGAAFNTGIGRGTNPRLALFMGIVNLRLGYWWHSGISGGNRPGRYPQSLWRKFKHLPSFIFRMQSLLVSEWRGLFTGPARRFWFLSDGGHFDNTGLYELLRRRVQFIIFSDAGADPTYRWDDLAELGRQVRVDFGAEITWLAPADITSPGRVPDWIQKWINLPTLCDFDQIKKCAGPGHAALAHVRYPGGQESWILLLKPCLTGKEPFEIQNYNADNPDFPQQPTSDQFFDDAQWESYRALGQWIGQTVLKSG